MFVSYLGLFSDLLNKTPICTLHYVVVGKVTREIKQITNIVTFDIKNLHTFPGIKPLPSSFEPIIKNKR